MAAADTENILAAWIGDFDTSQIIQSDGFNSIDGWDITSRPWYRVKTTGFHSAVKAIITIYALGTAVLILLISFISLNISRPIKRLAIIAEKIADGALDVKVNVASADETGLVAQAWERPWNG